jgi:phage tail protein X
VQLVQVDLIDLLCLKVVAGLFQHVVAALEALPLLA